jgi:hypothetical protein
MREPTRTIPKLPKPVVQSVSLASESQTGENSTGEQNLVFSRQYENFLRISEKVRTLNSSFRRLLLQIIL